MTVKSFKVNNSFQNNLFTMREQYFSLFIILLIILIYFRTSYFHLNQKLTVAFTLFLNINQEKFSPLNDAISCNKNKFPLKHYLNKTLKDRMAHSKWINNQISLITPKDLINKTKCYIDYCGPWIESLWIAMEKEDFKIFGYFIPLFVPWLNMWHFYRKEYFRWRDKIIHLMSKDYFYITLSQNDDGIEGRNEINSIIPDNLIIISSGGKGHIPIPLFLLEYNPNDFPISTNFTYDLIFAGRLTHTLRKLMVDQYSKLLKKKFKFFPKKIDWKYEYKYSKFICAPRGYGRNSFRLTEILQTGHIPVYIYNDIIWLPYYDSINWSSFSIITHVNNLNKTIKQIKNTTPNDIHNMRKNILKLYESHFTTKATLHQIKLFMLYGFARSDLRCATFSSIRG